MIKNILLKQTNSPNIGNSGLKDKCVVLQNLKIQNRDQIILLGDIFLGQ